MNVDCDSIILFINFLGMRNKNPVGAFIRYCHLASTFVAVLSHSFLSTFARRCEAALYKLANVPGNFTLINADAFVLARTPHLQSIWYKLWKLFCCTNPALSNKVLAHVSTGASKLPLWLQEPLKLLIAFCANGPYALDKVCGKSRMSGLTRCVNETACGREGEKETTIHDITMITSMVLGSPPYTRLPVQLVALTIASFLCAFTTSRVADNPRVKR